MHRGLAGFRGEAAVSTWVYRIALREALRVKARRGPGAAGTGADERNQEASVDGEAVAASRHEARRVAAALERLSAEHQAVLALFAVDGLSHREIAEVLGVPEGTVWSRVHLARRSLTAVLGRG